jgi:L-histidine N-alpha-methyltransferase
VTASSSPASSGPTAPAAEAAPAADADDSPAALLTGLAAEPATIAPKWFYDDLGSRLFSAITALPEYYPTRTEAELLATHLPAIAAAVPVRGATLIDLGAGNCEKAGQLFAHVQPHSYCAVDISAEFLRDSLARLQRLHPGITMQGVGADFSRRLLLPPSVPRQRRLFFYPGSSIGNFTPTEARDFLAGVREQMLADGTLWIGVDLQKPAAILEPAYDDALGVTAAFNKNVLLHANRVAGTDFALGDWRHIAFYAAQVGRIEMHLEAVRDCVVHWPGGQRTFCRGQRIHTENSYKYTTDGFARLLAQAGLRTVGHWTDARQWFAFFVAVPAV